MQEKKDIENVVQEIMELVDAAITGAEEHQATDMIRDELESALRELAENSFSVRKLSMREPLSMDDANKLWDDCLKKYKRPGPYELIVEFCKVTSASGEV